MLKTASARIALTALNSDVRVVEHNVVLSSENAREIFDQYDIIVNGCDNFPTRYLANDVAIFAKKSMVDGGIFRFEGQVTTVVPSSRRAIAAATRLRRRLRKLRRAPRPACSACSRESSACCRRRRSSSSSPVAGDLLTGRLLHIDALAMKFREFRVPRDPQCPVCGENPTITEPIDYEGFCAAPASVATEAVGVAV